MEKEDSLASRAEKRMEYKNLKEQQNLERITSLAAADLMSKEDVSEEEVDEDWASRFFNYAKEVSNEDLQNIWSKILAGEVERPNSFSLRTLEVLRNLSQNEAKIFAKVAKYAISSNGDDFLFKGKNEFLEKFNIKFRDIVLLQELGLLHPGNFTSITFKKNPFPSKKNYLIGDIIVFHSREANSKEQKLPIKLFTRIGSEFLSLITDKPNFDYIQGMAEYLKEENVSLEYSKIITKNNDEIKYETPLKTFKSNEN